MAKTYLNWTRNGNEQLAETVYAQCKNGDNVRHVNSQVVSPFRLCFKTTWAAKRPIFQPQFPALHFSIHVLHAKLRVYSIRTSAYCIHLHVRQHLHFPLIVMTSKHTHTHTHTHSHTQNHSTLLLLHSKALQKHCKNTTSLQRMPWQTAFY
jgi:hypothetical protein